MFMRSQLYMRYFAGFVCSDVAACIRLYPTVPAYMCENIYRRILADPETKKIRAYLKQTGADFLQMFT